MSLEWAGDHWEDPTVFQVCVRLRDDFQLFLQLPWHAHGPEDMVERVRELLERTPPQEWHVRWHPITRTEVVPDLAGPSWVRSRW